MQRTMLKKACGFAWLSIIQLLLIVTLAVGSLALANFKQPTYTPLDLRSIVNVDLADEHDGDQKGGWTDQGSANDIRSFPVGEQVFRDITFNIIDPSSNDGKAALVMYGKARSYFPKTARIPINAKAKTIYFLHTVAWAPSTGTKVADYCLEYFDGERVAIPIRSGIDLTNWWNPFNTENSVVGWVGSNPSCQAIGVNLYWLVNPKPDKQIKDLVIEATGDGVLCILGITLAEQEPLGSLLTPEELIGKKESNYDTDDWFPFQLLWDQAPIKGSAVDRSFLLDPPAGKHGFLRAEGDKFVFEDGTEAKFWGVNFSGAANFPTHQQAEKIAKRLAGYGINIVRLHHLDAGWTTSLFDKSYNDTQHYNAEMFDRLDYFIYCLKREGIYVYLDQLVNRYFKPGDNLGIDLPATPLLKGFTYFVPRLIELQKKYSYDLWTHYNPYTKLRYCDDPVIVLTEIKNENDLFRTYEDLLTIEPYAAILRDKWCEWREKRGLEKADDLPAELKDGPLIEFLSDLQADFYQQMMSYLREIGVKVPIAGTNWSHWIQDQPSQLVCDFIGQHSYWDHPVDGMIVNNSMLKSFRTAFDNMGFSAQHQKPLFISEWCHPWPNTYRAEATAWTAAMAGFQGWNGLTLYTYSHSVDENLRNIDGNFNRFNDPAYMGLMPTAAFLYLRGDVKQAKQNYVVRYALPDVFYSPLQTRYSQGAVEMSSYRRLFGSMPVSEGAIEVDPQQTVFNDPMRISDTGQIKRDVNKGLLTISTSGTEVIQGFSAGEKVRVSSFEVQTDNYFAVFSLSSVDHNEIKSANRLLLTVVARVEDTGTEYTPDRRKVMVKGTEPIIVEPVAAEIELLLEGKYKVWALNEVGLRKCQVPVVDNKFNIDGSYKTIWFEIVKE